MTKSKNIILIGLLVVVLVIGMGLLPVPISLNEGVAESISFEESNVLDDLLSSTVNGQKFRLSDYPFHENGSIKIINVVEYCYSYKKTKQDDYGLYIYIYNPQGLNINESSGQNKIEMATYQDTEGLHYGKFRLQFINKAEESSYKRLFYKYKVVDAVGNDGKKIVERVNSNGREYTISGIELQISGNNNATEFGVGGKYTFTGYAKGYGPDANAESNLGCVAEDLETLQLEVHHTYYRTNVSSLGAGHYNEVNTVYFSVPNRIFEEYGNLQKIHAEWWEYKTKPIMVTSNSDFYNKMYQYTGTDVGTYDASVPVYMNAGYRMIQNNTSTVNTVISTYDWTYNVEMVQSTGMNYHYNTITDSKSTIIPYAFCSPTINSDTSVFNFLTSKQVVGGVDSTLLTNYIYNYRNNLGHGTIDCNGRNISKDLFESNVDSGRTMGYNDVHIDLADTFDLLSYDSNHTWWDKLWEYGFSWPSTDGDYLNVSPIYVLKETDFSTTNSAIASNLLVNENDVSSLKTYYLSETAKGNQVVLFRFANTDYYCRNVNGGIRNTNTTFTDASKTTYIAQETIFFDFDIIDLTFQKDGQYHTIPIVSDPVDIVNEVTAPAEETEWWKTVVGIVLLVLLVIILAPLMPYILKGIVWLLSLPVKAIRFFGNKWKERKRESEIKRRETETKG